MGNWRTVKMIGTCDPAEVPALLAEVRCYKDADHLPISDPAWSAAMRKITCLTFNGGLAGLPCWPAATIDAFGNLFERDFTPENVLWALEQYAAVAPSLALKVHCGDDWEATNCVATVTLVAGVATIGPPEIPDVGAFNPADLERNLFAALWRST